MKLDNYNNNVLKIFLFLSLLVFYFIWWSPFIPSRNIDEVFTYNHIWLKYQFEAALVLRQPWF